eukprot:873283_1
MENGKIPCNLQIFGPVGNNSDSSGSRSHSYLYCWKSAPINIFNNPVGTWNSIQSCEGCSSMDYSVSIGMSTSTTNGYSQQFSKALSTSTMKRFEESFSFSVPQANIGYSNKEITEHKIQNTASEAITNSISSSFSHSTQATNSDRCDKGAFYQWEMSVTAIDSFGEKNVNILSTQYLCVDYGMIPQCPLTFCVPNTNCQECIIEFTTEKNVLLNDDSDTELGNMRIVIIGLCGILTLLIGICIYYIWKKKCKEPPPAAVNE